MMNPMIRPLHLSEKKVKNKIEEQKQHGLCRAGKEDKYYKVMVKVRGTKEIDAGS